MALLAALALALFVPAGAGAASSKALPRLWAVQVSTGAQGWFDRSVLKSLRKDGINALAVRVPALGTGARGTRAFGTIRAFAAAEKLYLIAVLPAGKQHTPAARNALAGCSSHRASPVRCALQASSLAAAVNLARKSDSVHPLVAVYVKSPGDLSDVARLPKQLRRRIVVIAPLPTSFDAAAWGVAIAQTTANASVNLGIAPQSRASTAVRRFGVLLAGGGSSAAGVTDTEPPSTPSGLATSSVTQTGMTLSWGASTDNVGVAGYRLFVDGSEVGTSSSTSYAFTGLNCGTSYTLDVVAYDAAGNVSAAGSVSRSTSACSSAQPPDTQPPSTPGGLGTSAVGQTGMTLSWAASSDNVGVVGYRLFVKGSQVGTSSSTSYAFTGMSCGTSYTLGVAAYDAAGNVSGTATLTQSTGACTDTQAPSKPTGLATSSITQTSATLSWTASTDNVGVTGYRVYMGAAQVGTSSSTSYQFSGLSCGTAYTLGVAAYDAAGNVSGKATKAVATSVCTSPPGNSGLPVVTGSANVGSSLTSSTGTWTNAPTGYTYKWQDCDTSGANCTDIATATSSTYTLQPSDLGDTVRAVVTATNGVGSTSANSGVTAVVQAALPPSGQTVMAFDLGWAPTSSMPWGDLTQAFLFNLATENGPGLDTSNVDNINIPAWVTAAHAHDVKAFISIGGEGNDNWSYACNDTNRSAFISNLVGFATKYGFDGIDLDVEDGPWTSQAPPVAAMNTCIEDISTAAHADGLLLSADVITNWEGPWYAPTQAYVDQYNLMTYGDSLSTMKSDVADTISQGLPASKFVVGVDVSDYPEPSGGCGQFETYAKTSSLMGSFVWAASGDTGNACMNALASAAG